MNEWVATSCSGFSAARLKLNRECNRTKASICLRAVENAHKPLHYILKANHFHGIVQSADSLYAGQRLFVLCSTRELRKSLLALHCANRRSHLYTAQVWRLYPFPFHNFLLLQIASTMVCIGMIFRLKSVHLSF